jgi:hypothetical protein
MVLSSLIGFDLASCDNPNSSAARRETDEQQAAFHHTDYAIAFFGLVLLQVLPLIANGSRNT